MIRELIYKFYGWWIEFRGCRHDWGEYESHYPCWTTATCKKCGEVEIF